MSIESRGTISKAYLPVWSANITGYFLMQKMPDDLWKSADLAGTRDISQTQLIDNRTSDYTPYD